MFVVKIKIYIYFVFNSVFFSENGAVYEIMWKKRRIAKQATDGSTIRRMRIASWLSKATITHSEYVTVIAFPLQQWLRERASVSRMLPVLFLILSPHSLVLNFNFQSSLLSPGKFSPCTISSRSCFVSTVFGFSLPRGVTVFHKI